MRTRAIIAASVLCIAGASAISMFNRTAIAAEPGQCPNVDPNGTAKCAVFSGVTNANDFADSLPSLLNRVHADPNSVSAGYSKGSGPGNLYLFYEPGNFQGKFTLTRLKEGTDAKTVQSFVGLHHGKLLFLSVNDWYVLTWT